MSALALKLPLVGTTVVATKSEPTENGATMTIQQSAPRFDEALHCNPAEGEAQRQRITEECEKAMDRDKQQRTELAALQRIRKNAGIHGTEPSA